MKINYENFVEWLLKEFPEYPESEEFKELFDEEDLKLPYIILGTFAQRVVRLLKKNGDGDKTAEKFFEFVNDQFANADSDPKLLEMLAIEVFENFAQDIESLAFARKSTNEKARFALESALWWTGADRPDPNIAPEACARRLEIEAASQKTP